MKWFVMAGAGVALVVVLGVLAATRLAPVGDEPFEQPQPISVDSPFRYPLELWDERVEGEVVVMVHVTDMGVPDSVYVLESSGREAFDRAALQGAMELQFAPARRGERRVEAWARLPVRFHLPGDTTPAGAS